jgi:hypothetical protein
VLGTLGRVKYSGPSQAQPAAAKPAHDHLEGREPPPSDPLTQRTTHPERIRHPLAPGQSHFAAPRRPWSGPKSQPAHDPPRRQRAWTTCIPQPARATLEHRIRLRLRRRGRHEFVVSFLDFPHLLHPTPQCDQPPSGAAPTARASPPPPHSHLIRRGAYVAAGLPFDAPKHDLSALCVDFLGLGS